MGSGLYLVFAPARSGFQFRIGLTQRYSLRPLFLTQSVTRRACDRENRTCSPPANWIIPRCERFASLSNPLFGLERSDQWCDFGCSSEEARSKAFSKMHVACQRFGNPRTRPLTSLLPLTDAELVTAVTGLFPHRTVLVERCVRGKTRLPFLPFCSFLQSSKRKLRLGCAVLFRCSTILTATSCERRLKIAISPQVCAGGR